MFTPWKTLRTFLTLSLATLTFGALTACDDGHGHADLGRLELAAHGETPLLLAVWTEEAGWQSPSGEPITALPDSVLDEEGESHPLRIGGAAATLLLSAFTPDGEPLQTATLEVDGATGEPTCSEYSVRYEPTDRNTSVLLWPALPHPESSARRPSAVFVETDEGLQTVFNCDRVTLFPAEAGEVGVRFLLWHGGHADGFTDPINVAVHAAE